MTSNTVGLSSNTEIVDNPIGIKELTTVLIKHYGIHEGAYDLLIENQVGFGMIGNAPDSIYPSAVVSLAKVGLAVAKVAGPNTIDASIVNPAKSKKSPKKKED